MINNNWLQKKQLKRRLHNYLPNLPGDLFKLLVIMLFLFPFYWMFITSFKTYVEAIRFPPSLWPKNFTLENYDRIFNGMEINLWLYLKNSVVITASIIVLQILIMVPAAYAFAKFEFFGKGMLFGIVLIAFMIPSQITFITVYLTMSDWGLIRTLLPQILPFGANAFGIFLLRQGFRQVPDEIIECAKLDGAKELKIMLRIMRPMTTSSMITIALFSFVSHWNAYFWPLVMTNNENIRPLTMAIEKIKNNELGVQWNTIMAANVILVIPVLIVFIFASKSIIRAFAYKGMK